jgi:hypothetical protein
MVHGDRKKSIDSSGARAAAAKSAADRCPETIHPSSASSAPRRSSFSFLIRSVYHDGTPSGQQKVTVEHVPCTPAGQAIVGVRHPGGWGPQTTEDRRSGADTRNGQQAVGARLAGGLGLGTTSGGVAANAGDNVGCSDKYRLRLITSFSRAWRRNGRVIG